MKKKEKIVHKYEHEGIFIKYLFMWLLFAVIACAIKYVVLNALKESPTGATAGNGIMTLFEVHNTGAAFNLFQDQPGIIIFASFVAIILINVVTLIYSRRIPSIFISSLAFLSAGISMNLYERLTLGYVIDYIRIDFIEGIPLFNTADIMIVFGTIGLIVSLLKLDR